MDHLIHARGSGVTIDKSLTSNLAMSAKLQVGSLEGLNWKMTQWVNAFRPNDSVGSEDS